MIIDNKGPLYDRHWMLVDKNSNFVTQRVLPEMSQIVTQLSDSELILSYKNFGSISVPIEQKENEIEVTIFNKSTSAHLVNSHFDEWLSDCFNKQLHLVRSPDAESRVTSGRNGPVTPLKFADGYPLLLTNQSTLAQLNNQLSSPVSMDRFRPNIVISSASADEEDRWQKFTINGVSFLSVKACSRCVIIQIDPKTSKKTPEVTQVLKGYRTQNAEVIFGNNLSHTSTGRISVGDKLTQIEIKKD